MNRLSDEAIMSLIEQRDWLNERVDYLESLIQNAITEFSSTHSSHEDRANAMVDALSEE